MKRPLLSLLLAFSISSGLFSGTVMFEGTYAGDTRYDANKLYDGNDNNLCWAAAASNVIKYWQDTYVRYGYTLPEGIPTGNATDRYNSDIFEIFVDNWENKGGLSCIAIQWWFDGDVEALIEATASQDGSTLKAGSQAGAYWAGVLPSLEEYWTFTNLLADEDFSNRDEIKAIIDLAITYSPSPLTAGILTDSGGAHAITIWGYEYNDLTSELTGFWITDSDDDVVRNANGTYTPADEATGNYLVDAIWDEEMSRWFLQDYYGSNNWYIDYLTALAVPIPEPAACALGLGILVLFFTFRRHKKSGNLQMGTPAS